MKLQLEDIINILFKHSQIDKKSKIFTIYLKKFQLQTQIPAQLD